MSKKFVIGSLLFFLLTIFIIARNIPKQQQTQTKAAGATTLSFSPASPQTVKSGQMFRYDVLVDPGTDLVSLIKAEITYNAALLSGTQVVINSTRFSNTMEGPRIQEGKITFTIAIDNNVASAIQEATRAATITFQAKPQAGTTNIAFTNATQVLSLGSNSSPYQNVLALSVPATVTVVVAPTATPVPSATVTPTIRPSVTPTIRPSVTPTARPSATPTPRPSATGVPSATNGPTSAVGTVHISGLFGLHGIGKAGDNTNPTASGTAQPQTPVRDAVVYFVDAENVIRHTATFQGTFIAGDGLFSGEITTSVTPGIYRIKIISPRYLRRDVGGIFTVQAGTTNITLPETFLITGDANRDEELSIFDYNMLLDCYADLIPAKNCSDPAKKQATDFTDDGNVNQFDYNLFLRELSVQPGN